MVDLIITYINNKDQVWRDTFVNFCRNNNCRQYISKMANERYSGVNWLPYYLKLVKKNMPFIRKVFLVVSNKEQVNDIELSDNIEIVLHKDFIPYQYLPTFNSTTIELFLPFIKGLSEKFIYSNDDMLPTQMLQECNFFEEDKIKIKWILEQFDPYTTQFKYQCNNNQVLIRTMPQKQFKQQVVQGSFLRPVHSMTPMIKSHCIECYKQLEKPISRTLTRFRNDKNLNQYLYPIYEWAKYGTLDSDIKFLYTEFMEQVDINNQIVCVNVERNKENVDLFLKELDKLCD